MAEITHADLLAVQRAIIDSVRHDIGLARREFKDGLGALKAELGDHEVTIGRQARELARLDERTRPGRGFFASLSKKQKAAVAGLGIAAGGVLIDGVRHLGAVLLTALQHGARP